MIRRPGTTLVEVLVAVFIMAIGLMTLLTLFPLGALSMRAALQDGAAANVAANAAAVANAKQIRHDQAVVYDQDPNAPNGRRDVFIEPLPRNNKGRPSNVLPPITDGPSYPVYVDPVGYWNETVHEVGDKKGTGNWHGMPRRTLQWVASQPRREDQLRLATRFTTTQDDLNFNRDDNAADPANAAGSAVSHPPPPGSTVRSVERNGRYSWAWLLRRPQAADPSVVDVAVVVYAGRSPTVGNTETVLEGVTFAPQTHQIQVPFAGAAPDIVRGSWVLDATLTAGKGNTRTPEPHGYFYRVIGVVNNGTSLTLETEQEVRNVLHPDPNNPGAPYVGTLIFVDGVIEVFAKGAGWRP